MSALQLASSTNTSAHNTPRENSQEASKKYYLNKRSQPVSIQTHTPLKKSRNQQNFTSKTSKNSTIEEEIIDDEPKKLLNNFTLKSGSEDRNGRMLPRLNNPKNDENIHELNPRAKYKENALSMEKTTQVDQKYLSFLENLQKNLRDKKIDQELKEKKRVEELNKIRNEMGIYNVKSRVYDFARRTTQKLEPMFGIQEAEVDNRATYNRISLASSKQNLPIEDANMASNLLNNKKTSKNRLLRELSPGDGSAWVRESRSIQRDLGSTYTPSKLVSPTEDTSKKLRNTLSVDAFKESRRGAKDLEGNGNIGVSGDESKVFERKRENKTLAAVIKNETDIGRWKRLQNINLDTKVFIIIGGYEALKRALIERGWIENPNKRSACFDLKWTTNECDAWGDLLIDSQLINHYPGNEHLVTKAGLCKSLRNVVKNVDQMSFYPRCYEMGNQTHMRAFIEDFKITKVESILKRFIRVPEKLEAQFKSQVETALKVGQRYIKSLSSGAEFKISEQEWTILSSDELSKEELANKKHNIWLNKQGGGKAEADNAESQKYDAEKMKSKKKKASSQKDTGPDQEDTGNLNNESRQAVRSLIEELNSRSAQSTLNGENNIWIVKPARLSRGRGIVCCRNLVEILDRTRQGGLWVVQKYIENPLIIHKRKFDIRQWVLVTDWNPLTVWFYEECYLRFGALEYDTSHLENRYIHLTNNSVTKYCKAEEEIEGNMWSSMQFEGHLKKANPKDDNTYLNKIKPNMKKIAFSSLLSAQKHMEPNKNCFELFGYDFMVDEDYNVWLIEINCSPAMDYSTKVTERLVKMVLQDTAKVIVDSNMGKKNADTGLFTKLGKNIIK